MLVVFWEHWEDFSTPSIGVQTEEEFQQRFILSYSRVLLHFWFPCSAWLRPEVSTSAGFPQLCSKQVVYSKTVMTKDNSEFLFGFSFGSVFFLFAHLWSAKLHYWVATWELLWIVLEKLSVKMNKPLMTLGPVGPGSENQVALAVLLCARPWLGKELKSKSGKKKVYVCFFSLHSVNQGWA